jgi:hypothetical protein
MIEAIESVVSSNGAAGGKIHFPDQFGNDVAEHAEKCRQKLDVCNFDGLQNLFNSSDLVPCGFFVFHFSRCVQISDPVSLS